MLRQQLQVLRRKAGRPRFTPLDRVLLAVASRYPDRWVPFLVTPQTLLRWHRTLVRRKWTYRTRRRPGRPPLDPTIVALIVRLARENPRWGCVRICGELRKLGIHVGRHDDPDAATTPRAGPGTASRRADLDPVPASPGQGDRGLRLLHRRDDLAADAVRAVLHRTQHQAVVVAGVTATRTPPGSPSRPEPHDGPGRSGSAASSCCATTTPSSPARSTRSSTLKGWRPCGPRSGRRRPTPTPSGGWRPSAPNAWTGRWSAASATSPGSCRPTSGTTTSRRPHRGLALALPQPREHDPTPTRLQDVRRREVLGGLIHEYHAVAA